MSYEYDQYLQQHRNNVKRGFEWLLTNLPTLLIGQPDASWQIIFDHDSSKNNDDEYTAYDDYFYGNNRSYAVTEEFKRAWLRHIHRNPHHWQYWVLNNDDPNEGEIILDMPYNYIIEMICDWWSFSWQKGNLGEIFNWYDEHSDYIKLSPKTRKTVEDILEQMRNRLGLNALAHHGIKGQKWGVKNGPPYPLDSSNKNILTSGNISDIIKSTNRSLNGKIKQIPDEKFTDYALDFDKSYDKANTFKEALGYTKNNYKSLIKNINDHFDADKLEERGDNGYGMRYQQIMKLKGPNNKEANVLTAWIEDDSSLKLTSVYVTKKGGV